MNLFTYGVLMHPELLRALTGHRFAGEPAALEGFRRHGLVMEGRPRVPAIVRKAGAAVEGVLVHNVDEESLRILDAFEEVDSGLYSREPVHVLGGDGRRWAACAYVAGPRAVGALEGSWDPEEFLERYFEEYQTRIIPRFLGLGP